MVAERNQPATVEEEVALLKAALRSMTGPPAPSAQHPSTDDSHERSCPVCRANHLVHAAAPGLLDEIGRGLAAAGRLAQDAAAELRRHTAADRPDVTTHEGDS